ncbi:hypothetical protein CEXT_512731 [Caerostris extrusa]|uniref:Uncharacterized protein n=1 Tax=Caerostris extrusa TaxID=172846 RepID=A0AAV4MQK1_CAEEX|nr:hypothetical protein CEXT_512731 [Caerostris extrusa]
MSCVLQLKQCLYLSDKHLAPPEARTTTALGMSLLEKRNQFVAPDKGRKSRVKTFADRSIVNLYEECPPPHPHSILRGRERDRRHRCIYSEPIWDIELIQCSKKDVQIYYWVSNCYLQFPGTELKQVQQTPEN